MGLLSLGTPLDWSDAAVYADHVRKHGITQFLNTYSLNKHANRHTGVLHWGDEVEYMLIRFDPNHNNVTLSLRAYDVLTELTNLENQAIQNGSSVDILWRPEYAKYMLEGTPGSPYSLKADDLGKVQDNMRRRRLTAMTLLDPNTECLVSLTCFPRLGDIQLAPYLYPHIDMSNPNTQLQHTQSSQSLFVPDDAINPHPRFHTLTANIRQRRGEKVAINVPIYHDKHTPWPFHDPVLSSTDYYDSGIALPNHIYMDCMCFGMGCSCLQITLQASHVCEARHLYDQLAVLSPIMLSLTASSPIFRGYLANVDCRWNVIAGSVDDRTRRERGLETDPNPIPTQQWDDDTNSIHTYLRSPRVIPKSRYDSISCYLSRRSSFKSQYNDISLPMDQEIYNRLIKEGDVDHQLAQHLAHLFIRDPLVIYRELLHQNNSIATDHFENIQSTNWQTMRFKPPPNSHPELGWRVEFRSMEVQPTDFENAAYSVFVVLLSRIILCLDLDLYIPLSLVDMNMNQAQKRDAILTEKFWFRIGSIPSLDEAIQKLDVALSLHDKHSDKSNNNTDNTNESSSIPSVTVSEAVQDHSTNNATDDSSKNIETYGCCTCSSFAPRSRNTSPRQPLFDISSSTESSNSKELHPNNIPTNRTVNDTTTNNKNKEPTWIQMPINTIMNGGSSPEFPGLIPLVKTYLTMIDMKEDVRHHVDLYLNLISDRAAGRVATSANWMRQFVMNHSLYNHDSRVTPQITHDLLREVRMWSEKDIAPNIKPIIY